MFSLCFQKFRREAERVFISDNLADDSYIFFLSLTGFPFRFFVYWLYPRSRVYETVRCPSVRPSVCLSQHRTTAANPLLARRAGDIDRLLHGRRSAAAMWRANAGSATFQRSQEAEQSCSFFFV